jgi:hypothetical protein
MIKPGDIFCSRNPMALGRAINAVQKIQSEDDESQYSHAGIIVNEYGDTFESLWTIRFAHLSAYEGQKVLIGRLKDVSPEAINAALAHVLRHNGKIYPAWRLVFHLFPLMAKYVSSGEFPVCSELAMEFVKIAGIGHIGRWQGKNPDHVADFIRHDRCCEVVFEGEYPAAK